MIRFAKFIFGKILKKKYIMNVNLNDYYFNNYLIIFHLANGNSSPFLDDNLNTCVEK